MRRVIVFNSISVDGYMMDKNGDMSWAHAGSDDAEWNAFVSGNASGNATLVFGRNTYEMMAGFWPTPMAAEQMPAVAERMNALRKVVFSRTLDKAEWNNTTLFTGDLEAEVKKMKSGPGEDIVILGSGRIVSQLTDARLIDEYQVVVIPVALGAGRTMFDGIRTPLHLTLVRSRSFMNGNMLLCYEPNA